MSIAFDRGQASDCFYSEINGKSFPYPVSEISVIETHISWVILAGEFAYKIKKPVDLGFVDYTSLQQRKHFCEEEVRLNRRYAPDIYLGVAPIFRSGDSVVFGEQFTSETDAEPVEYAVKMKQFPQTAIVANRLSLPELSVESVEGFGRYLADFHNHIESAIPNRDSAQPEQIVADASENLELLVKSFESDHRHPRLIRLQEWTLVESSQLRERFRQRLNHGMVRRCHGDLHLKNVIQTEGKLTAFDGIEFNERFQFVDVLSELAFPVMDFFARGRADLGWRLLNAYLEATGEFEDLDVLRFFLVYRAMVRAKVTWLNPRNHGQNRNDEVKREGYPENSKAGPWDKYIRTAEYFAFELKPKLSITHGFSGSGKSTCALKVIDADGGIRIRSDVLRQKFTRQYHVEDKYSQQMTDWVYASLAELAADGLKARFPIVVDATFLQNRRRLAFRKLADDTGVPFEIIHCTGSFQELSMRLADRKNDPSEANVDILKAQIANHDPLSNEESQFVRA